MKEQFYKGGQKAIEVKGNTVTYYYKDGGLRAKGRMVDDMMQGKWIFYRETGQLWQVGHFKDNLKHGSFLRYDRKDRIEYQETFVRGKIVKKPK